MVLTLSDVLAHPLLRPCRPRPLSGWDVLDRPIRWVHSTDLYDVAGLLRGGEVLLTNGVGLVAVDEPARRLYIRQLADRAVAGLLFEVGRTFAAVPAEMIHEAEAAEFPIIELQPAVRFAELAEAVNSELLNRSVAKLQHADETSRALSESLARGASLSGLVGQVAEMLGTWARLSDYSQAVVVEAGDVTAPGPYAEAQVVVDGTTWGRLSVGTSGATELLCDAVLDRAPTVLALCLIRERKGLADGLRAQHLLLDQLITDQRAERGVLESRLRMSGIATSDHRYVCVALDPQLVDSAPRVADGLIRTVGHGIFGLVGDFVYGVLAAPAGAAASLTDVVTVTARAAVPVQDRLCVVVSRTVSDIAQLPRAMADARATLLLGRDLDLRQSVADVHYLALERLLASHGDSGAIRQFVDDQIGPIVRSDAARQGQLLATLEVLIESGGSKVETAKRLHIRRQSLYYRLDQIERLLGVALDDPRRLTMLAVALAARRLSRSEG